MPATHEEKALIYALNYEIKHSPIRGPYLWMQNAIPLINAYADRRMLRQLKAIIEKKEITP
jgi:hypothetical protein